MNPAGIAEIIFLVALIMLLSYPLGIYMARIFLGKRSLLDRVFGPLERGLYALMGINPKEEMDWKEYLKALLITNALFGGIAFAVLSLQQYLPLNPNHAGPLSMPLAFTTAVSFATNTDLQHYTGELQLSYFSQMMAITFLMFVSAATGICCAVAFIRGISGQSGTVGNFYKDFVISMTRILIPITIIEAIVYVYLGIPQTFQGAIVAHTINMGNQTIFRGPVATLEAIKFLGTNGGGYFGAGSSYPFENPGPITNYLEMITEAVIPFGLIFSFGQMTRNTKEARMLVAVTLSLFLIGLGVALFAETSPNHTLLTLP
ncbi:MAG: potassium-transporting ATPase subunit KdpA, partial [Methanomassiliicoccales archaeon]